MTWPRETNQEDGLKNRKELKWHRRVFSQTLIFVRLHVEAFLQHITTFEE